MVLSPGSQLLVVLCEGVWLTQMGHNTEWFHGTTCELHMMIPVPNMAGNNWRGEGKKVDWERPRKQGKVLPGHCPRHWPGENRSRMLWAWCCFQVSGWHNTLKRHCTFPRICTASMVLSLQGSNIFVQSYRKYFLCSLTHCSAVQASAAPSFH